MSSRATCLLLLLVFATIALTTAIKTDSSSRKLRGRDNKRSNQVDAMDTRKKAPRKQESDKASGGGAGGVGGGDKKGGSGGGGGGGDKKDGGDQKGGGGGGGDKKGGGGGGGGGGNSDVVYEVNENKNGECDRSYFCANPTPVSSWSCADSC